MYAYVYVDVGVCMQVCGIRACVRAYIVYDYLQAKYPHDGQQITIGKHDPLERVHAYNETNMLVFYVVMGRICVHACIYTHMR